LFIGKRGLSWAIGEDDGSFIYRCRGLKEGLPIKGTPPKDLNIIRPVKV